MFIKKDLRKVPEILEDEDDRREQLKLARRFSRTRYLSLYNNELDSLEGIGALEGAPLAELNLGYNLLREISPQLAQLRSLKRLSVEDNELEVFPEVLLELRGLEAVHLSGNGLTELPESLSRLAELRELAVERNRISRLPSAVFALTGLKKLLLGNNCIQAIPDSLGDLPDLEFLGLNSNELEALPRSVGSLTRCKRLMANGNRIGGLPATLAQAAALQHLNLANNRIDAAGIPPECVTAWKERGARVLPAPPGWAESGGGDAAEGGGALEVVLEGNPAVSDAFHMEESEVSQGSALWKKQAK